jgi:SAM-dependent methyltransferase
MSNSRPSETIGWYDRNAQAFVEGTLCVGMGPLYHPFLELLPPGAHILDAGCGSGRDAREFKRRGYRVTAFDAAEEVARLASEVIGQTVAVLRFQDLAWEDEFDGVWACASLLHVPAAEMDEALARLVRSLRRQGILYTSFKLGEGERVRDGRLFCDHAEDSLGALLARHPDLDVLTLWRTHDQRPSREGELWVNATARRRG